MFTANNTVPVTNWRFGCPSSTIWLLLTVEFLIGALISSFLAILNVVKSLMPKPPRDLTGDVVVIAGAASSFGKSLAEEFAKCGCSVVCVDQDAEAIERIGSGLKRRNPTVEEAKPSHRKNSSPGPRTENTAYECDLFNRCEILRTAQKVKDEIGGVDILVTCVGNVEQDIFDVASKTLLSHFWTVLAFLPLILYRERGHIVGVTPVATRHDAYLGSRAAITSLMTHLCNELSNRSSQLTFLAFSPIARCRGMRVPEMSVFSKIPKDYKVRLSDIVVFIDLSSTLEESEKKVAAGIVQAVRTDRNTLDAGWTSKLLYRISCTVYRYIAAFTEWIHSQESESDYPS